MITLINPENYAIHQDKLRQMYQLRYKIFKEELNWKVETQGDQEKDALDEVQAHYLVCTDDTDTVRGFLRLIAMDQETMFDRYFPTALPHHEEWRHAWYYECSRLGIDPAVRHLKTAEGFCTTTIELCTALIAFGQTFEVENYLGIVSKAMLAFYQKLHFLISPLCYCPSPDSGDILYVATYAPHLYTLNRLEAMQQDKPGGFWFNVHYNAATVQPLTALPK